MLHRHWARHGSRRPLCRLQQVGEVPADAYALSFFAVAFVPLDARVRPGFAARGMHAAAVSAAQH
jgi:hypothetical protein